MKMWSYIRFYWSEIAVNLGYSYNVPFTDLHIGASAKLISSTLDHIILLVEHRFFGALYVDQEMI
jgi:hypothetical protein